MMETTRMLHSAKSLDEQNQTIKRADKGNCSAQTLTLTAGKASFR